MELPSSGPRHITIFTVPAGTPSGSTNMKLGRFIPSSAVDHWGIYIESADDYETHNGLCIELDRSEDGGIMARDRTRRQREEKEPQKGIKYDYTGKVTSWEDKRIIQCGTQSSILPSFNREANIYLSSQGHLQGPNVRYLSRHKWELSNLSQSPCPENSEWGAIYPEKYRLAHIFHRTSQ